LPPSLTSLFPPACLLLPLFFPFPSPSLCPCCLSLTQSIRSLLPRRALLYFARVPRNITHRKMYARDTQIIINETKRRSKQFRNTEKNEAKRSKTYTSSVCCQRDATRICCCMALLLLSAGAAAWRPQRPRSRRALQQSIDISCPQGAQHSVARLTGRQSLLLSIDGTYRQTDVGRSTVSYPLRTLCGQRQKSKSWQVRTGRHRGHDRLCVVESFHGSESSRLIV